MRGNRFALRRWLTRASTGRVVGMSGVAQIEFGRACVGEAVAPGTRRHHAIEHVDAAPRRPRRDRPARRRPSDSAACPLAVRRTVLDHRQHDFLRLADGEPAERVTFKVHLDQRPRALEPQRLRRRPARCRRRAWPGFAQGFLRALGPAQRQLHGARASASEQGSFTHSSNCIWISAPSRSLNLHGALWRQHMPRAVDVGLEGHAILVELAEFGE